MKIERAYSLITVKSVDEDKGILRGIASTPETDRMGDIVEPDGAQFKLPIPLLWQHRSDNPIGSVTEATVTKDGIEITASIARGVSDEIDRAWKLIKAGLVRGLSIGFRGLEAAEIKGTFGIRFIKWEWLELSAVTIPANAGASIQSIKSIDRQLLGAASGASTRNVVVHLSSPGATGKSLSSIPQGNQMKLNTAEQIKAMEAERAAKAARMSALMEKSGDEGRTLDESEQQEYDGFASEVKSIDNHLVRLRDHAKLMLETSTPIVSNDDGVVSKSARQDAGTPSGSGVTFQRRNLPKGTAFTRYAMAIAAAKGDSYRLEQIIKTFFKDTPEVELTHKAAVAAGTTADANFAGPLVYAQDMASEFIDLLRPLTILGRVQGLRRIPFNVRMGKTATGTSSGWVGEGAPKPLSAMDFDTVTHTWAKIASIVVLTQELMRFSNPDAEQVVRDDMLAATSQFRDQQFVDPSVAAVASVSPASVTYGVTPRNSTGITFAQVSADVQAIMQNFITASLFPRAGVWLMHPRSALALSQVLMTGGDTYAFPTINMNGGTFFGFPVITSANVPIATSNQTFMILMDAAEIFFSEDPGIRLDASDQASVQMDSAPDATTTASTVLVSLWQRNLVGLRAEQYVNWTKRRAQAVQLIDGVTY